MSAAVHADVAIECRGVTKRFGDLVAIHELDVAVRRGEVVGYLGPNGAGKSTTIRILLDLSRPDAGTVRVLGEDPRRAGPPLRTRIGYLPGELRLDDRLRVDETLRSWSKLRGDRVERAYVDELCDRFDLDVSRRNRELSSGNRRKVGLVGAFMSRPDLLILDEPTAGVDPLVQAEFLRLVGEVSDDGQTVFLSSHILSEVEQVADRVVVIRGGTVVADGALDELIGRTAQTFVVVFEDETSTPELASIGGVTVLDAVPGRVRGVLDGDPNALLRALAQHRVAHLELSAPDLEQTFLEFYDGGEPT